MIIITAQMVAPTFLYSFYYLLNWISGYLLLGPNQFLYFENFQPSFGYYKRTSIKTTKYVYCVYFFYIQWNRNVPTTIHLAIVNALFCHFSRIATFIYLILKFHCNNWNFKNRTVELNWNRFYYNNYSNFNCKST